MESATPDPYLVATAVLASSTGVLGMLLVITCCCCYRLHRQLLLGVQPESTPQPEFTPGPSWNADQGYPTQLVEWGGHCSSCGAVGAGRSPCQRCQAYATAADDWMIPDEGIFAMSNNISSDPYMMPASSAAIGQESGGRVVLNAQAGGGGGNGNAKLNAVAGGLAKGAFAGNNGAGFNNARPAQSGIFSSGGQGAQFVLESL